MSVINYAKINWQQLLTLILVALFIITLPVFSKFAKNVFDVLSIIAIVYLFKHSTSLPKLNRCEKKIFYAFGLFLVWAIFTFYINGQPERGYGFLWHRQLFIIMLIPLYYLFRRFRLGIGYFIVILVLSIILMFANTVFTIFVDQQHALKKMSLIRVGGGMNPIQYGSIAMIMFSIIVSYVFFIKTTLKIKSLIIVISVGALFSLLATQARGAWFGLPVLLLVWVFYFPKNNISIKARLVVVGVIFSVLSLSYFIEPIQKRVDYTVLSSKKLLNGKINKGRLARSSMNTRLSMWKASMYIFLENKVFGVGLGGYQEAAKVIANKKNINKWAYSFYHPHNQFISELASKGLPGMLIYLAMLVFLIRYFILRLKQSDNAEVKFYAFIGLQLVILYFVFSLTDAVIESKVMLIYFVLLLALIMAKITPDNGRCAQSKGVMNSHG